MRYWPALDVRLTSDPDLVVAAVDDFSPTAVEERGRTLRVFFSTKTDRDRAQASVETRYDVEALDVADEDWARRSQVNLLPIRVGRVVVLAPWADRAAVSAAEHVVVIEPSMGFGTGHHSTTRLCLRALQMLELGEADVLDVGTGSGVLAIAAARLGAARALGIDHDIDALESAIKNLALNSDVHGVSFALSDLTSDPLPVATVVTANLTGALLIRMATKLGDSLTPGGALIVSGILNTERDDVISAFSHCTIVSETAEDEWVGLLLRARDEGTRSSMTSIWKEPL